jgi:hypothetical protein
LRVLKALSGVEVRGNSGAWLMAIRNSVLLDHWRAKERERRRLGNKKGAAHLDRIGSAGEESLRLAIEHLPAQLREAAEAMLHDPKWQRTVEHHEKKQKDEKRPKQSLEWDGERLPLRNKRSHRGR